MPDDSKEVKSPKIPNVAPPVASASKPDEEDPADAFKRVTLNPDEVHEGPKKKANKKKGDGPRQPAVEQKPPDDEPMDPMDAASEIVVMLDGLFTIAAAIRGYDKLAVEGKSLLAMVQPDDEAKTRMRKALARLMRSAGTNMSPGAAVAFTALTCYGAPIATLEFARASAKRQGA